MPQGRPLSPEHRAAISAARLGKPHPHKGGYTATIEARAKMSLAHLGRPTWSKGKKRPELCGSRNPAKTPQARAKISAARRARKAPSGAAHPRWKGGTRIKRRYRVVFIESGRYQFEHRFVMERVLGRKLLPFPYEIVHHKNGDTLDNRPENLEVMNQGDHAKLHKSTRP